MVGPLTNGPLRMYKAQSMADSTAKIEFILLHHGAESPAMAAPMAQTASKSGHGAKLCLELIRACLHNRN